MAVAVGGELEVPALALQAVGDQAQAGPRVEPAVEELQLRLGRREASGRLTLLQGVIADGVGLLEQSKESLG